MYATFNIHVITHNLEFLQVFHSRQEAIDHLKKDAESHINKFRGSVRWITKKAELLNLPDGYYLRLSQKHANRIVAYEVRTTIKRGYIYNSSSKQVAKTYVYEITELPHEPIMKTNFLLSNLKPVHLRDHRDRAHIQHEVSHDTSTTQGNSIDAYINELKACLKDRRIRLGHSSPYLPNM